MTPLFQLYQCARDLAHQLLLRVPAPPYTLPDWLPCPFCEQDALTVTMGVGRVAQIEERVP